MDYSSSSSSYPKTRAGIISKEREEERKKRIEEGEGEQGKREGAGWKVT